MLKCAFRKNRRQPPYSQGDANLLAQLISDFDPKSTLFSAQRDAGVTERKRR